MSIKRRVQCLEAKAGSGYLTIEGILRIINLEKLKDRTPEEQRLLEELSAMEIDPKLDKTLTTLREKRGRHARSIEAQIS